MQLLDWTSRAAGRKILNQAIEGKLDYESRRKQKQVGSTTYGRTNDRISNSEQFIKGQSKGHYPAPVKAVKTMKKPLERAEKRQSKSKPKDLQNSPNNRAQSLIGLFLNDQLIKAKGKKIWEDRQKVEKAAVLGAGIMGGGIAYQSAYKMCPSS